MTPGLRRRAADLADSPAARLLAIALVLGAALAALLAALVANRTSSSSALLEDPVTVKRALSTTAAHFGDPVEAEIDVYSNDLQVEPGSIRTRTSFTPYRVVATRVERESQGDVSLLRTRISLQCLTRACLPPRDGARLVRFPPLAVTYRRAGHERGVLLPWAPLQVSSRIPAGESARLGIVDSAPPLDPQFARSPTMVRTLLLLAATLLAIAGAVLVVTALWPASLRSRRRWQRLSPLERTLLRLEAAAGSGDEALRRQTLDQLATELGTVPAPSLEARTRALAWGYGAPEPEALTRLAEQVRGTLNGGVRR